MFERTRSFLQGVRQLLQNPNLLQEYKSLSNTLDTYYKQAQSNVGQLQTEIRSVRSELDFHKRMEMDGITLGQTYFDRELDDRQRIRFQQELADPGIAEPQWQRGYSRVTRFHTTPDGVHMVEMDGGTLTEENFFRCLRLGILTQATPAQMSGAEAPASMLYLKDEMRRMGFTPRCLEGESFLWSVNGSSKCFSLDGWRAVEDLLARLETGEVCGMLIYPSGESQVFTEPDHFVHSYQEELNCLGPMGVSAHTISDDPEVRKQIDDLRYDEFGLENPNDLDFYRSPPITQAASMEADADMDLSL